MRIHIVFIVALLFGLSGCNRQPSDNTFTMSIDPTKVTFVGLEDFCRDIETVRFHASDTLLIGGISNLVWDQDRYFVLDNMTKSVFIFSADGTLLKTICQPGRGPQEYLDLSVMAVDFFNREIHLIDNQSFKILTYDFDGQFRKEIRTDYAIKDILFAGPHEQIVVKDKVNSSAPDGHLINIYTEGKLSEQFLPFTYQNGESIFDYYHPVIQVNDSTFVYQSMFDNTIRRLSHNGLQPVYQIDFTRDGIPASVLEKPSGEIGRHMVEEGWQAACNPYLMAVMPDYILFNFNYKAKPFICKYDLPGPNYQIISLELGPGLPLFDLAYGYFYANGEFIFMVDPYRFSELSEAKKNTLRTAQPSIYEILANSTASDNTFLIKARMK